MRVGISFFFLVFFGPSFIASARAAETIELIFHWLPVDGADKYVIEISKAADFVDPLVIDYANTTEYRWKTQETDTIHWRVAADGKRKGLFSPAQKLSFAELLKNPELYETQGVILKSPREEKSSATPVPPTTLPSPPISTPPLPEAEVPLDSDMALPFQLSFYGGYGSQHMKLLSKDLDAKISGGVPVSIRAGAAIPLSTSRSIVIEGEWNQFHLKPEPALEYPFQKNLSASTVRATVMVGSEDSLLYGLSYRSVLRPERTAPEQVSFSNRSLLGLAAAYRDQFKSFSAEIQSGVHFGQGLSQGDVTARVSTPVIPSDRWSIVIGLQIGAELQIHPELRTEMSQIYRGVISIGFEWEDGKETARPDSP